jgi:hypothetical protein
LIAWATAPQIKGGVRREFVGAIVTDAASDLARRDAINRKKSADLTNFGFASLKG